MKIEQFLKESLGMEKEAWAVAEVVGMLVGRTCDPHDAQAQALVEEYAQNLMCMQEKTEDVIRIISALPCNDIKKIFAYRYLNKMTWAEVAEVINFSSSQVYRMHKDGIKWLNANWQLGHFHQDQA